ncbi:MAG: DUF362 domain-containing protein [Caldilineales bacterium]|nr:DUF362 domain-containing protein [Caldilineales bacterium]
MSKSKVAILRTSPRTVLADYHRLMNLAGYQDVIAKDADTALKVNISWHFFYPGSSTTPWQLEGVIRAMKQDGYDPNLIHACHNRTVVIDAHLGERENKQINVVQAHGLRNIHLYEGEEWIHIREAVGDLADKFLVLNDVYPGGFYIPRRFIGENIIHLPTVKCVHPDTEIVLANGDLVRIGDLVENELKHGGAIVDEDGDTRIAARAGLLSLSDGGQLGPQATRYFWRTPLKGRTIWRVRTRTGREVKASAEHPFLTPQGWRRAASLQVGDRIAIPRKIAITGQSQPLPRLQKTYGQTSTRWMNIPATTSPDFWRWLGYFMAEGWMQPMSTSCRFWFSNADSAIQSDYIDLSKRIFGLEPTQRADEPYTFYFDSLQMQEFFGLLGLTAPLNAGTKHAPALLFRCPDDEIAAFLQGYFDGDGAVGQRDGLHAVTKSERLAGHLHYLLARLGVVAFKGPRWSRSEKGGEKRWYHEIAVYGDELVALSRHIRLLSAHKQERLEQLVARRQSNKRPSNWDTIPVAPETFRSVREGLGFTQASTGRPSSVNNIENRYTQPTRPLVQYFVERFEQADTAKTYASQIAEMAMLAREDMAWDHIVAIEEIEADCEHLYDFTMEAEPNFVGNGMVLHNTHIFTTTTGAMKNAFGGLLNERRHWTHPVIHETLVDLLLIQKHIHRGVFAVMDGTFAGDGPGPRCMVPYVKNVLLASDDQVAIDAMAAKLMGLDPMSIKFIRLAHEQGLGCGDPSEIEVVGDEEVGRQNWHFVGPFQQMTFASRMQHKIYWGPLKKPIEWSLKTVLAPWSYLASVIYHDSFWYPFLGKKKMAEALESDWGHLFRNWETVQPDALGYPQVGQTAAELKRTGLAAFWRSFGILWTAFKEAPEIAASRRPHAAVHD